MFLISIAIIIFDQNYIILSAGHYINDILEPFENLISKTRNFLFFWQSALFNIKMLKEANVRLASENLELYGKLKNLYLIEEENSDLKKQLNLLERSIDVKRAEIISRDYQNNRTFVINKGAHDGVTNNMAIIAKGDIIIGQVVDAGYSTSKVRTILDVQTKIAATTLNSRTTGLVRGLGSDIVFELIAKNKNPERGELIISSGTDGTWPHGFIIGKVGEIKNDRVFSSATIEMLVDIKDLINIFVIINK